MQEVNGFLCMNQNPRLGRNNRADSAPFRCEIVFFGELGISPLHIPNNGRLNMVITRQQPSHFRPSVTACLDPLDVKTNVQHSMYSSYTAFAYLCSSIQSVIHAHSQWDTIICTRVQCALPGIPVNRQEKVETVQHMHFPWSRFTQDSGNSFFHHVFSNCLWAANAEGLLFVPSHQQFNIKE